jgi:hypothetical protein
MTTDSTEVPVEVWERASWHRAPEPLDPTHVSWYPRDTTSRGTAWRKTIKYGEALKVASRYKYNGWRRCHTEHYWAWYAVDFEPKSVQLEVCAP